MDAQATWYQRLFPWLFRAKEESKPVEDTEENTGGEPYYEIWFDGTSGSNHWWFAVYDANGKRIGKDYWFSESSAKQHAKDALKAIKLAEEAKRQGKTTPTRYYA